MRIGVDVGGTNTDAILLDGARVLATIKTSTTADTTTGIVQAIREILHKSGVGPHQIGSTMIGTTHFTNALVECKRLLPVGILRLGAPATFALPPLSGWPAALKATVTGHSSILPGGYNFDGRPIAPLDRDALRREVLEIRNKGIRSIAVCCVFSSVRADMELEARDIIREILPDAHVTLSHQIGRVGLMERENAAIMNAALGDLSRSVITSFRRALEDLDIRAPFFISQNDGTLMKAEAVEKYPILTIASGPTNSMRGAAFLTGLKDAIVVDIGGTTSDVGVLTQGFPRESSVAMNIGGVRTNFRMPDILAIGLGGGSHVRAADPATPERLSLAGTVSIGPDSVGYELTRRALCFGGQDTTVTDIAVAAGILKLGNTAVAKTLTPSFVAAALEEMHLKLEDAIDRMKTSLDDVPVILVGGGSALVNRDLKGASEVIKPENAGVANAIGAAISQVSGEVDRIFSYETIGREAALETATREALEQAANSGAADNLRLLDIEEIPLAYVPGGAVRIRAKAVGDLPLASSATTQTKVS